MDIVALSRKHLEDAVELGYITVNGKELPLTAPQILAIAKSIVKDSIVSVVESEDSAPSEMFTNPLTNEGAHITLNIKRELDTDFIEREFSKPKHDYENSLTLLESDY